MGRRLPTYRRHPNGQAFVEFRGKRTYLGKYDSPESRKKYSEIVAQIAAGGVGAIANIREGTDLSINELLLPYLDHCTRYYSENGKPTKEFKAIVAAMKMLSNFAGGTDARLFGPRALTAYQQHLVSLGHGRVYVNMLVAKVKRFFRWACVEERLPPDHFHKLLCVRGLESGRCSAPDSEPVRPVPRPWVEATIPHLSPTVATMVQVQMLCGMRPSEVCIMRACDLSTTGDIWLYRVPKHKGSHRGIPLVKAIPKVAQELLKPFLTTELTRFLFSPRDTIAAKKGRFVQRQRRQIRERYDTDSYRRAVNYAIRLSRKDGCQLPHWHPHQLRHTIATEISQDHGQQAAQIWLGHSTMETTGIYAERQVGELIQLARELDRRWAS